MHFQVIRSLVVLTVICSQLQADEPTSAATSRPIYQRFEPVNGIVQTDEIPDFQKHVSPLLGRLGCNGRACHGSFQGQGGLILSLFGYDFKSDYDALLSKESKRVDLEQVTDSLILKKPIREDEHGGGKRFEFDSWQYWVLRKWVDAKAPFSEKNLQQLEKLVVTPTEILFRDKGQSQQLQVVAYWKDGWQEDVTALARFHTNDPSVAEVTESGLVTANDAGDTHVVVSYDNAVVPVSVIRPLSNSFGDAYPQQIAKKPVDQLIIAKLKQLGAVPSANCSDAEFLRRVSLDVTGTLPTTVEVVAFMKNTDPQKRSKKIDELLERPGYAALWTTFLCDITGNNEAQLNNFFPAGVPLANQWYQWLYKRVADNVPYDQLVEGIVTATSRMPGESYREYCESMSQICRDKSGEEFAQRPSLVYYWARNNFRTTEDRAVGFAYSFLGIRIQCAQCHKHPFDQWSKNDFDNFEKLFAGVTANQNTVTSDDKKVMNDMIKEINVSTSLKGNELRKALGEKLSSGETVPFPELTLRSPAKVRSDAPKGKGEKKSKQVAAIPKAKLLGGAWVDMDQADVRGILMDWLRQDNPYFAKAFVNRVWAHYFAVGIVHPADDLNLANAPSNAPLLDYLAQNFVANGYDMKWLHREILNSDAYQRSWETNETNRLDKRNFSHAQLKRLPAESAYDAIYMALANDHVAQEIVSLEADRALSQSGASRQERNDRNPSAYALRIFGRSSRESNCDCDRSNEPSLLQTVFLANDQDIHRWLSDPKTSWTVAVADKFGWPTISSRSRPDEKLVRELEQMLEKAQQLPDQKKELQRIRAFAKKNNLNAELKRLLEMAETDSEAAVEVSTTITVAQAEWIVENAYLRTLSRLPKEAERSTAVAYLTSEAKPVPAIQSLMWSLVNTKEFILNH
jgi:Protein of unknown function (DUF1549)/Protein of unknown function (DUF1553)